MIPSFAPTVLREVFVSSRDRRGVVSQTVAGDLHLRKCSQG
jgi:hypothetical protein